MSKRPNSLKSKAKSKPISVYDQEDKGLFAILVADLHSANFAPLSNFVAPSLLPLNNVPILYMSLSFLIADGFKNIIIYASSKFTQVQAFISHLRNNGCFMGAHVTVKDAEKFRCVGDIMRDLDSSEVLSGVSEFLLAPADLICGVSLSALLLKHKGMQDRNCNAILTLLLSQTTSAISPVQATEFSVSVVYSQTKDNKLIAYSRNCHNEAELLLLSSVMHSGQTVVLSTDFMNIQLYLCSKHIPLLFQDNFDYETMDDLISDALTNEEIMEYTMHIEPLPSIPLTLPATPDLTSLMNLNDQLLARRFGFQFALSGLCVKHPNQSEILAIGPQCYISSSARVHPRARLIGACFIDSGCKVDDSACLINCILGSNCFVGKKSFLRRVVALDNVYIGDNVKSDTAWLCSRVRLLTGTTLPCHTFVGPSDTTSVTLGPGTGSLRPKGVFVAPQKDDTTLNPVMEDESVLASSYKPIKGCDDLRHNEYPTEDESKFTTNAQYKLWETAWDRIKSAARTRRRLLSDRQSRNRESRSSKSFMSRHLTDELGQSDIESEYHLNNNVESGDEMEHSEEFLICELKGTLERGQKHEHPIDTIILEVNSLKHAYNISVDDLSFLLTKALLDLTLSQTNMKPKTDGTGNDKLIITEYVSRFRTLVTKLAKVFGSCTSGCQSAGRLYLQAVEDAACYDTLIFDASAYLFHALYNDDLVTESDIRWWKDESPLLLDDDVSDKTSDLREKLSSFFEWLEQTEEESSDDEDNIRRAVNH